ncbi:hypothetical protein BpHYR1_029432, partial [Brachionus plicatilis]
TDQRCVSLVVDAVSPVFENPFPTGLVDPIIAFFTINAVNVPITKSTRSGSYIRIFDSNNTQVIEIESVSSNIAVINSKTLIFSIDFNFTHGETYYVLFDTDVAQSNQYCGLESLPIDNETFWVFTIKADPLTAVNVTINIITPIENHNNSNDTISIDLFNKYVSSLFEFYSVFLRKSTLGMVSTIGAAILLTLLFVSIICLMSCFFIKTKSKSSISPITKINLNTNHVTVNSNHLDNKQIDSLNSRIAPIGIIEDIEDIPMNGNAPIYQLNERVKPSSVSNPNEVKPKRFVRDSTRFNFKENPDSYV